MAEPIRKKTIMSRWIWMLALAPAVGNALDVTLQAGYGATYTNNTQQAPEHGTGEWIQEPELNLIAGHEGPTTSFTADYNATREIHQRDIFGDETIVAGVSTFTWYAIADRLSFDASNERTRTTIDAQGQDVPSNLQVTDTTIGGATLTLNSFGNHSVELGYHYTFDNADTTNTDSRRQMGDVAYIIPLSLRSRVQLNAALGKVDFDSSTATNYVSREGGVQYVAEGDRVDVDTSLGYTVFDQDGQLDDVTGTTGYFDLAWRASANSTVTALYSRSLGDGALDSTVGIPQFGQPFPDDNSGLTQPYTAQEADLGLDTRIGHNTVGLVTYFRDQKYEDISDQDQSSVGGTIRVERRLRQTLTAILFADYADVEFQGEDRTDHDFSTGLQLDWARWRNLSLYVSTIYTKRNSDDPTSEFTEWQGALSLLYTLMGPIPSAIRGGNAGRGAARGSMTGGGGQRR